MKNEKLVRENNSQWGVVKGEGVTPILWHVEDENEKFECSDSTRVKFRNTRNARECTSMKKSPSLP